MFVILLILIKLFVPLLSMGQGIFSVLCLRYLENSFSDHHYNDKTIALFLICIDDLGRQNSVNFFINRTEASWGNSIRVGILDVCTESVEPTLKTTITTSQRFNITAKTITSNDFNLDMNALFDVIVIASDGGAYKIESNVPLTIFQYYQLITIKASRLIAQFCQQRRWVSRKSLHNNHRWS